MAQLQVTPTQPFTAWQIVTDLPDPAHPENPSVLDSYAMMQAIAAAGYRTQLCCYQEVHVNENGTTTGDIKQQMTLMKQGYPDQDTIIGGYVVFDGVMATVVDAGTYQTKYAATS